MTIKNHIMRFGLVVLLVLPSAWAGAFSTHASATLTRDFSALTAETGQPITVTATFTQAEGADLRGCYFAEQVPDGLTLQTVSVTLGGAPAVGVVEETSALGDVHAGTRTHRWILETPILFTESTPVPSGATLEIVYTLTSAAVANYDLDEFHWVGYYAGAGAAYGYSEPADSRTLVIIAPPEPLEITTANCPDGLLSTPYSITLQAQGGLPPYTWALESDAPPGDLAVSAAGVISGTPDALGTFNFSVRCTDSDAPAGSVTQALSIRVIDSNSTPSFTSAAIHPAVASVNSVLSVVGGGWSDPDGDPEDYQYQWRIGGVTIPGATGPTLTNADFAAGDDVSCTVTAWDGTVEGNALDTAAVHILQAGGATSLRPGWMIYE